MKHLGNLKPAKGANKAKKRKGRGIGSGLGKTAGKGHKGQKARKGAVIPAGFEGGQMPLYRRLPKRGFKNNFGVRYNPINLETLNRFEANSVVTLEDLEKAGLIKNKKSRVKLLAKGKLDRVLTIKVHKASEAARRAVEGAGGKIEEI